MNASPRPADLPVFTGPPKAAARREAPQGAHGRDAPAQQGFDQVYRAQRRDAAQQDEQGQVARPPAERDNRNKPDSQQAASQPRAQGGKNLPAGADEAHELTTKASAAQPDQASLPQMAVAGTALATTEGGIETLDDSASLPAETQAEQLQVSFAGLAQPGNGKGSETGDASVDAGADTGMTEAESATLKEDAEAAALLPGGVVSASRQDKQPETAPGRPAGVTLITAEGGAQKQATAAQSAVQAGAGQVMLEPSLQERLAGSLPEQDFKLLREQLQRADAGLTAKAGAAADPAAPALAAADNQSKLNSLMQSLPVPGAIKTAPATASVAVPVSSPDWGAAMSQRIVWLANRGISAAELQLNPRELGPVDVRISVSGEQTHVQFSSQHAAVREVLENSAVRLREMMESSGLNLGDVNVSDQSLSGQAQAGADERSGAQGGTAGSVVSDEDDAAAQLQRVQVSNTLIDFYA